MIKIILILALVSCFGCADARLLGREGRLYLGIPFGQGSSDLEARKFIPLKFGLVEEGMTKKEVLDKFGEPHHAAIYKDKYQVWYYESVVRSADLEPIKNVYIFFDDYSVIKPL